MFKITQKVCRALFSLLSADNKLTEINEEIAGGSGPITDMKGIWNLMENEMMTRDNRQMILDEVNSNLASAQPMFTQAQLDALTFCIISELMLWDLDLTIRSTFFSLDKTIACNFPLFIYSFFFEVSDTQRDWPLNLNPQPSGSYSSMSFLPHSHSIRNLYTAVNILPNKNLEIYLIQKL